MPLPVYHGLSTSSLRSPTLPPTLHPKTRPRTRHILPIPRMSLPTPDPVAALARFLWGRSLPPQPLVAAARFTWTTAWHVMMSQLAPSSSSGSYTRPTSPFRSVPEPYWSSSPSSRRNLHLYVGLPCPWAQRTLVVRALKNLESVLPVSVATPGADGLWEFSSGGGATDEGDFGPGPDRANGRKTLKEVYGMRRGGYDGRSVVPLLWDVERREVVCNESYGIIEFLNSGFGEHSEEVVGSGVDLAPPELRKRIEEWNEVIYPKVNNGVYRCGFAQSQEAYDAAVNELFANLDMLDAHLATSRYLCGDVLTLADVCLFTTLIRFDLVYNVLFKCTKKKLLEYPNLYGYTQEIYQIPKVAATCNFEAILDGYYCTLFPLNPGNIRPVVPTSCKLELLSRPHGRGSLSSMEEPAHVHAI